MRPLVLIIEDDVTLHAFWHDLLAPESYVVRACDTPAAAREIMRVQHPNLIVLDYLFGGVPLGQFFLRTLVSDPHTQHIPVIVHSGANHLITADEGFLRQHRVQVVRKPCAAETLLHAVTSALTLPPRSSG